MSDCRKCADCDWCAEHEECDLFKPKTMTHADSIRAMSDEELMEFIYKLLNEFCPAGERPGNCIANCRLCWSQWLKQEET